MQAHKMSVLIPEDHQLVVEVPRSLRSGPAELIFLVPAEATTSQTEASQDRMAKLAAELAQDPRDFGQLTQEEKRARLKKIRGIGRGALTSSEDFARQKALEIELEDRKFDR